MKVTLQKPHIWILLMLIACTLLCILPKAQGSVRALPDSPNLDVELVGQIGGSPLAVAVQGDYAYVGLGPRLAIIDTTTPGYPTIVRQTFVL